MHVRWRKKRLKWFTESGGERFNVSAELVASVRIGGKVRQRFVASLGSYQELWDRTPTGWESERPDAVTFWTRTWRKLYALGLDEKTQGRIVAKLAERVPPPDWCKWSPGRGRNLWEPPKDIVPDAGSDPGA